MTAEIAIMNKLGVALAADSAATIGYQSGNKIYNSANKLFMLSAIHPVGIMVYGSSELTGVPWETIVKLYRVHIGDKKLDTLQHYVTHFISFLEESQVRLFPSSVQKLYLSTALGQYLLYIREEIQRELNEKKIDNNDAALKIWINVIDTHKNSLDRMELLPYVDTEYQHEVEQEINDIFPSVFKSIFGDVHLPDKTLNNLKIMGVELIVKNAFLGNASGLIFAGFGENEIFPSVISIRTEGLFVNRLRQQAGEGAIISFESSAAIVPFAQSEMVSTFMEGINPDYRQFLITYISNLLANYPESLAQNLPGLKENEKAKLSNELKQVGVKLIQDFMEQVNKYQSTTYSEPIINNVAFLPIDELASMAEALVNLTSFKRHISSDSETVGGPIDVAVISKKDGFIWIKRKHYFRPELNQHFFAQHDRYLSDSQE